MVPVPLQTRTVGEALLAMKTGSFSEMLDRIRQLDRFLVIAMRWSIITLMTALVVIVFIQILARYTLSISLTWSEEAARLVFICTIFLGSAILVRDREHLTVTVFVDLVPARVQSIAEVLASAVGLWCSYFLVSGAWSTLTREWDQLTPALRIPMGTIYSVIFAAVTLMSAWLLLNLMESVRLLVFGQTDKKGKARLVSEERSQGDLPS